jgi:hypothetical protein
MASYRLYLQTDEHARVQGFEQIEADDDSAAVAAAVARRRSIGLELWCANRLVRRWELVESYRLNEPRPQGLG